MSRVLNYITETLIKRQEVGLQKYGESIDNCDPPTGSFKTEVIEEILDALQYMTRLLLEKEDIIKKLEQELKCHNSKTE
jgi:hypothetical protein